MPAEQYLQVRGATLCYEVEGNGPYIVFVAGANGGRKIFMRIRDALVKHFTVVLYDRRGYYNSMLTGPQDYSKNVATNAEDLHLLMKHITDKKFILFSSSASGDIALEYLITYPSTISKAILHEPLLILGDFPNAEDLHSFHQFTYRVYHREDRSASLTLLGNRYFNELDRNILLRNQKIKKLNSSDYFLEHELCEDVFTNFDLDLVKIYNDKLIFMYGVESKEYLVYEFGAFIAKSLGKEILPFTGGHMGYYTHTKVFAQEFIEFCEANSLVNYQPKL